MGKISKALNKYARERGSDGAAAAQDPPRMPLTQVDYDALVNYDRFTGHLVQPDLATGDIDGAAILRLRRDGAVERLLDNGLIYPGGKLTPRGMDAAARLERQGIAVRRVPQPPPAAARAPVPEALVPPAAMDDEEELIAAYEPAPPATPKAAPAPQPAPAPVRPVAVRKAPTPADRREEAFKPPVSLPDLAVDDLEKGYDESRIDRNLVALLKPHSFEAEQFKILRSNILYPVAGNPPRSILVTSSEPEEGKTFVAANLAISIALNVNKHVLLIDADLRRPQLHTRFGFDHPPGLSNYLEDGRPLASLLLKTRVDKLTLLPGGPPPANPSELISSERMANLLAEVTARYSDRLIVIDAPPPALTAETSVLARQVEGILVVIRFGKTSKEGLSGVIESVGKQKILGTMINYMESSGSRYYGYKYGGYRKSKES